VEHGGDLTEARRRFGEGDRWIDLSTGINPWPYLHPLASTEAFCRLPERDKIAAALCAARAAYGAPEGSAIALVPGTQLAINLLPFVVQHARSVAILGPTYRDHQARWARAGANVTVMEPDTHHAEAALTQPELVEADVTVIVNPNNPDGRVLSADALLALAQQKAENGTMLIVDEAFADVTPACSLVPHVAGLPAVVLRSFGKFYGLAGLRLGFAMGTPAVIEPLSTLLGPWAVGGPALEIGATALSDTKWAAKTRKALHSQAKALDAVLKATSLSPIGHVPLFRMVMVRDAHALHTTLARAQIWTRVWPDHPHRLRIGLPGDQAALERLGAALEAAAPADLAAP